MKLTRQHERSPFDWAPWVRVLAMALVLAASGPAGANQIDVQALIGTRQEYNDNIFFSSRNQESDVVSTALVGLTLQNRNERLNTRIGGRWEAFHYWRNEDLEDVDQHYDASLDYRFTERLRGNATARYDIDNRPDSQIDETGIRYGTPRLDRQSVTAGVEYQMSEQTTLGLNINYRRDDYEEETTSDLKNYGAGLSLSRLLASFDKPTFGRLNAGYARYEYDQSQTDYYYLNIGFDRRVSEVWNVALTIGPRYSETEYEITRQELVFVPPFFFRIDTVTETERDSNWGGSGRLAIGYQSDHARGTFSLSQDLTSGGQNNQVVNQTEAQFEYAYRWHWAMEAGMDLRYFYNRSVSDNPQFGDVDEQIFSLRPWMRYRFNDDLALQASYRYTYEIDNDDDLTYDRNQVMLELTYRCDLWP